MKYFFNSEHTEPEQEDLIERFEDEGVEVVDAKGWSDEKREEVYFNELMPRSVRNNQRLRGKVRSHQAGQIRFSPGVLLTHDNFYIGDEVRENLNLLLVVE